MSSFDLSVFTAAGIRLNIIKKAMCSIVIQAYMFPAFCFNKLIIASYFTLRVLLLCNFFHIFRIMASSFVKTMFDIAEAYLN